MKEINQQIINNMTQNLWVDLYKMMDTHIGKKTRLRQELEFKLHDKLEDRIKYKIMIPIQWRLSNQKPT